MGYTIEISFDILKHSNVSSLKQQMIDLAVEMDCHYQYSYYEYEKEHGNPRHHCIIAVHFLDETLFACAKFIKTIKKIRDVNIECIYEDDILCKLIYASNCYLKHVDKRTVVGYNQFKRERSYSDNESMLLEPLQKKPSPS